MEVQEGLNCWCATKSKLKILWQLSQKCNHIFAIVRTFEQMNINHQTTHKNMSDYHTGCWTWLAIREKVALPTSLACGACQLCTHLNLSVQAWTRHQLCDWWPHFRHGIPHLLGRLFKHPLHFTAPKHWTVEKHDFWKTWWIKEEAFFFALDLEKHCQNQLRVTFAVLSFLLLFRPSRLKLVTARGNSTKDDSFFLLLNLCLLCFC